MASRMPIVKQASFVSLAVQIVIMGILLFLFYQMNENFFWLPAIITFYIIFFLLRKIIPRSHRKGISLYKKREFESAVPYFQDSYAFFKKHEWVDKYRFFTMLSSSRISYSEMALLNIAFCQSQAGKKEDAIKSYKRVLEEFGDSEMAVSALKMLE
jgi:tetratricopeptide (TPR) repeat protein